MAHERGAIADVIHRFREPSTSFLWGLVVAHALIAVIAISVAHSGQLTDPDIARFRVIAGSELRPYREMPVEFPPGQLLVIELVGRHAAAVSATLIAVLTLLATLLTAAVLDRVWGRSASVVFLGLSLLLAPFTALKLDAAAVVTAVAAAALIARRRDRTGGLVLAASIALRFWPAVLLPSLIVGRRVRATIWATVAFAAITAGWVWYGGIDGPVQVATFRHAYGWEIGSVVGSIAWAAGTPLHVSGGAFRVGDPPAFVRGAVSVGLLITIVAICWRQGRRSEAPFGLPALVSVAALLVWSPILSLQYVSWLVPWAAISWSGSEDDRASAWVLLVIVLTVVPVGLVDHVVLFQACTIARGVALGWLVLRYVLGVGQSAGGPQVRTKTVPSPST